MVGERYMEPAIFTLIKEKYGPPSYVLNEVPVLYNGRIDIVYLYDDEPYSIAIELKINDWRKGLKQAFRNLFYAKYSYLAIQWKRHRRINLDLFARYGIGLIAVNGKAEVILEPRESDYFHKYKSLIINYLRGQIVGKMVYSYRFD